MDIEQLRTFERIVREGSFSRAARSLDIAQPSISARIQALEHEVGGPLFVRGGRTLALTELGESFLPYCRRALAVLAEGIEAARLTEHGERGRVTLGTVQSLSRGFVASAVARFHAAHPQVELFIRTGHSDQVVEMLDDGAVKLGLIIWPFFGADLMPLLRFSEPLVLVVAAEHPLAGHSCWCAGAIRHQPSSHASPSGPARLSRCPSKRCTICCCAASAHPSSRARSWRMICMRDVWWKCPSAGSRR